MNKYLTWVVGTDTKEQAPTSDMAHSFVTCAWSFATLLSPNKKQTSKSERMMNIPGCDNAISATHPFAAHAWSFPALATLLSPNKRAKWENENEDPRLNQCHKHNLPLWCLYWILSLPCHPSASQQKQIKKWEQQVRTMKISGYNNAKRTVRVGIRPLILTPLLLMLDPFPPLPPFCVMQR